MTAPICESCGKEIHRRRKWSVEHYNRRRFCDKACEHAGRPDVRSDYRVTESGCWEWLGRVDANGYGRTYDPNQPAGRRNTWAHRVSYELHRRPILDGLHLDHTCCNTQCINPDHLEPVTHAENMRRVAERRTTCKAGTHDWAIPRNVDVGPNGRRSCAECRREKRREQYRQSRIGSQPASRAPISPQDRQAIVAMFEAGHSKRAVAKAFGVDRVSVRRFLKRVAA